MRGHTNNSIFRGVRGEEADYMLQNVEEAQHVQGCRPAPIFTVSKTNPKILLFTPQEFQKLCEWNAAPVSRSAKMKLSLAKKKVQRYTSEMRRASFAEAKRQREEDRIKYEAREKQEESKFQSIINKSPEQRIEEIKESFGGDASKFVQWVAQNYHEYLSLFANRYDAQEPRAARVAPK